jgi:hypothetical protein
LIGSIIEASARMSASSSAAGRRTQSAYSGRVEHAFRAKPKHRNRRSASAGMGVRLAPESVFDLARRTHAEHAVPRKRRANLGATRFVRGTAPRAQAVDLHGLERDREADGSRASPY